MDISSLGLKMIVKSAEEERQLDWLGVEPGQLLLAPLFTLNEGDTGEARPSFPPEYELDHIARGLILSFTVEKSDITGLHVRLLELAPGDPERWEQLLKHVREHLGRKARVHPRVTIPEFQLGLWLSGASEGKGKIFDISVGGMRVVSETEVSVGQSVAFRIDVPETIDWAKFLHGTSWQGVVRNVELRGFSVEFGESRPFHDAVKRLVDELTERRMKRLTYPRYVVYDFGLSAVLEDPETGQQGITRLKDISVTGAYLLTPLVMPVDQNVLLTIEENDLFPSLKEPFPMEAHVVRGTPDGIILSFHGLTEPAKTRLATWTGEVASKFRADVAPSETGPKPKATLSISYGSDLLFIREYLYNISAGGLFLSGVPPIEKGEIVKFVLDLSGTKLAHRFPEPPAFLGKVVRVTDQGIGVQFVDPEQIRIQLESVISEHTRQHKAHDKSMATLKAADDFITESDLETSSLRRIPNLPSTLKLTLVVSLVVTAGIFTYRKMNPVTVPYLIEVAAPPVEVTPETAATPEGGTTGEPAVTEPPPESVVYLHNGALLTIRIADIIDVTYKPDTGGDVILRTGEKFPAPAFVAYIEPSLREKYDRLVLESLKAEGFDPGPPPTP